MNTSLNAPNLRGPKRVVVAVIGGTVTLLGIALIVLPGPAFIVIPIGLSILATEFLWARRLLEKARAMVSRLAGKKAGAGAAGKNSSSGIGAKVREHFAD